jgi:hypothetical protein
MIYIPTYIKMDHIFIMCYWLVVLLNLVEMKTRNCKIWLRQGSSHSNKFSICLISRLQYERITFMTLRCNTKRGWGTITRKLSDMVVLVELLTSLPRCPEALPLICEHFGTCANKSYFRRPFPWLHVGLEFLLDLPMASLMIMQANSLKHDTLKWRPMEQKPLSGMHIGVNEGLC